MSLSLYYEKTTILFLKASMSVIAFISTISKDLKDYFTIIKTIRFFSTNALSFSLPIT
jgi:hypothetical protein